MASDKQISDDWEEISDDDAFSLVSAPVSDPDTVVVPFATDDLCTPTKQSLPATQLPSPPSPPSPPAPSSPIEIPHSSPVVAVAEPDPHSADVGLPADLPADLPAAITALCPIIVSSSTVPISSGLGVDPALDKHLPKPGDSIADAVAATEDAAPESVSLPDLILSLAMVQSAHAEVVRVATTELLPIRAHLGQQILDACTLIGRQVKELHTILSGYKNASSNEYLNAALREWLSCVKRLLQEMRVEVTNVAYQSLDMANSSVKEELQSLYTYLVDYSQNMEEFLPIMLADCNETQSKAQGDNAEQQALTT